MIKQGHENRPVLIDQGQWPDGSFWEVWESPDLPFGPPKPRGAGAPRPPITAVACVAICNFGGHLGIDNGLPLPEQSVILTRKSEHWQTPGGHLIHLKGGRWERYPATAARETKEETGAVIDPDQAVVFGYREMNNPGYHLREPGEAPHTKITVMPHLYAWVHEPPGAPTDPQTQETGAFTLREIEIMKDEGLVQAAELLIIKGGVEAALRNRKSVI